MTTFSDLNLDSKIIKAIEELGFVTPTDIQAKVIPTLLNTKKDIVGLAQTGTGKTAAFGLPIIQNTKIELLYPQTLILSPTRELCIQITKDLKEYAKYYEKLNIVSVYGGASIDTQIKNIKRGAQIIVGTPGRVIDLIKRKRLDISKINSLILDEADEMLNMGFKEEIDKVLLTAPKDKQTLLFSATMPKRIAEIANKYMNDKEQIVAGKQNTGAKNVEHAYYMVRAADRYKALKRIVDFYPNVYGIVFCRTRRETKEVAEKLMQDGYTADALHGDLSQAQRDQVMHRFRLKNLRLLIATDVAARGIDVSDLTHVINYNLPEDSEAYIHRSGRTGRAGKKGRSIVIIHSRELGKIKIIEKKINKTFKHDKVPLGKEICEKQLFNLVDKVEKVEVNEAEINKFLPTIFSKFQHLDKEGIIKHFISAEFNRFLTYYETAPDLNISKDSRNKERNIKSESGFTRYYLNIGKVHKLAPTNLIGLINENLKIRNVKVGKIEILKNFSFFELEAGYESQLIKSMNRSKYKGIAIVIEQAKPRQNERRRKKRNRY